MSTSPDIGSKNVKPTKVVIPKVWKRPHSTIYGKNVEFGNKLYSDKLGEINGRKFNSELPWQVRNSGPGSTSAGSSSSQGYLSNLLNEPQSTLIGSVITPSGCREARGSAATGGGFRSYRNSGQVDDEVDDEWSSADRQFDKYLDRKSRVTPSSCSNYADVLELTNPNRYSKRRLEQSRRRNATGGFMSMMHDLENINNSDYIKNRAQTATATAGTPTSIRPRRIDFYDNYLEFSNEISRMNEKSRLANDPLLQRSLFDRYLDFNYELGIFVPSYNSDNSVTNANKTKRMIFDDDGRSLLRKKTIHWEPDETTATAAARHPTRDHYHDSQPLRTHETLSQLDQQYPTDGTNHYNYFNPVVTTTKQTNLLPKHACQLADSPYGQSPDGRKLSLGSINPHSYRPSLPQRTTTVHSSDGEEFEFQDRSSPFYTDRWAGRTIRHFDSDLYSNAGLFKSMLL